MTYLITDAIQGKRRAEGKPFAKRIAFGVYQHITGNGIVSETLADRPVLSKKAVAEAMVSVRILKQLHWEPERIILELDTWPAEVVEEAINRIFTT